MIFLDTIKALFIIAVIMGIFSIIVIASDSNAQTSCLEDAGEQITLPSTETDPVEMIKDDLCYGWADGGGFVDHHHFYVNGIIEGTPTARAFQWKMPAKGFTYKIEVDAVGINQGDAVSQVSDPFFVTWVDRDETTVCVVEEPVQCLDSDRVIPCP